MFAIRTAKNKYKFIDTDRIKAKAFNVATAGLAIYGLVSIITN